MILVLLGTQDKPFPRILRIISRGIKRENIKEKVIAQTGCTEYNDPKIQTFDFTSKEKIEELIDKARIIITHAGVGTITECINKGKKVIVVPRLSKYNEHTNDHQLQITKEFAEKGYIIPFYDKKKFVDILENAKKFKPKKYESNTNNFIDNLKKYIEEFN